MHRHRRRTPERRSDFFLPSQPPGAAASPGWSSLPDAVQRDATALMARLLVAHAAGEASKAEDDADER